MAGDSKNQMGKPEGYQLGGGSGGGGGGGSPSCGTPRHNWRSVSWTGRSREREAAESSASSPASKTASMTCSSNSVDSSSPTTSSSSPDSSGSSNEYSRQTSLLCPPLSSLSVSRRFNDGGGGAAAPPTPGGLDAPRGPGGEERKLEKFHKGRNGLDIKLDLGAVQEVNFQEIDASEPSDSELSRRREKMALCEKQCSRIRSHLYFGSSVVAQDFHTLRSNKISHILNCVGYVCAEYFPEYFHYRVLWLQDSPSEDLTSVLYDCFDYFEDVKEQGGRVYVHCCQGVSRSAAIVIAYLMWREGRQFEDVFQDVKNLRGVTSPNMGFAFQLMQWQSRILGSPKSPTLRMFRMAPHSPYDPLHLVPKSVNNPSIKALDSRGAFVIQFNNRLYVWQGRMCGRCMAKAADKAAFQLIRYEHALGPTITVREGHEPSELLDALNNSRYLAMDGTPGAPAPGPLVDVGNRLERLTTVNVNENSSPRAASDVDGASSRGPSLNNSYDGDFEAFDKARSGEVLPALPDSTNLRGWDGRWNTPKHEICCSCQ
ncbi:hypothetical protein R1flu_012564 [Riccia fluitans]|uniref:Uncharacterized protein n=1 Tax=Riccia fluitans TaxID=41844 RepID=A0ABD1ZEB9_9MARC